MRLESLDIWLYCKVSPTMELSHKTTRFIFFQDLTTCFSTIPKHLTPFLFFNFRLRISLIPFENIWVGSHQCGFQPLDIVIWKGPYRAF